MTANPYSVHELRAAVAAARRINPAIPEALADDYFAQGKTISEARADLFTKIMAAAAAMPSAAEQREMSKANMRRQIAKNPSLRK